MLDRFTAKGAIVGKLIEKEDELYIDVAGRGLYPVRLSRDFSQYVEEGNIDIFSKEHLFIVSPETKPRGYTRLALGQVAHKPYISFIILDVDPKRPTEINTFTIKATCIKQYEPTEDNTWYPYSLMALCSYENYVSTANSKRDRNKTRIIKVHGVLPRESKENKRDAVGSTFEMKCSLGTGKDSQRLFIVDSTVARMEKVVVERKVA